jgi:hypothetical protein
MNRNHGAEVQLGSECLAHLILDRIVTRRCRRFAANTEICFTTTG